MVSRSFPVELSWHLLVLLMNNKSPLAGTLRSVHICVNAPEGCQHGTHTNGTDCTRGTSTREFIQYERTSESRHSPPHKHTQTQRFSFHRQQALKHNALISPTARPSERPAVLTSSGASCLLASFIHSFIVMLLVRVRDLRTCDRSRSHARSSMPCNAYAHVLDMTAFAPRCIVASYPKCRYALLGPIRLVYSDRSDYIVGPVRLSSSAEGDQRRLVSPGFARRVSRHC